MVVMPVKSSKHSDARDKIAVSRSVISKEEVWRIHQMGLSALGEIANIITGNAATQLAANGFVCDIAPPVMIEPRGSTITSTVPKQILVTLTSELGDLNIRIGLNENARYQQKAA